MNRVCSIFSQILQLFSRDEFALAVREHRAERHARGFTCWGQFVAMLFCQLGQAQSLREICGGLAACEGKLKHLGVPAAPRKSTLSYANEHRPWELYQTVFHQLFARIRHQLADAPRRFRFRNPLLAIDSSLIDLCSTTFDWALWCRGKGAAKLHLVLDAQGHFPRFAHITEGRASDLAIARSFHFEPGTILVCDRAYFDYCWFQRMCNEGVFFVTRLRSYCRYEVLEDRPVPADSYILSDQVIRLGSPTWHTRMTSPVRRIELWLPEKNLKLTLVSNLLKFSARTLAEIYRERWKIEVFFRALKQTLRVKTFVGTSANALKIQIWTALIAMLLLQYLKARATIAWSLSMLVALLRQQLFVHPDLWRWISDPWQPPEDLHPESLQMPLLLDSVI